MKNPKLKSMLITASICALVFTGCGTRMQNSTRSPIDTKPPTTQNYKNNTSNSIAGTSDQTAMKNLYSKTLKGLVTARTITQTQSDKVLTALTQNMSQAQTGTTSPQMGGQTGTTNQDQMETTNQDGTGTNNQGQMGTSNQIQSGANQYQTGTSNGTSSNMNVLSSLVKSNVITQAQANIIDQKIQAAMKNM